MKKLKLSILISLFTLSVHAQESYYGKFATNTNPANSWYKLAHIVINCSVNTVNISAEVNYVGLTGRYQAKAIMMFRCHRTGGEYANWQYNVSGNLATDVLKLVKIDTKTYELLGFANSQYAHVSTGLSVTQECNVAITMHNTAEEVSNVDVLEDIPYSGSWNYPEGKVGIGTLAPDREFHIRNDTGIGEMVLQGKQDASSGNGARIILSSAYSENIDQTEQLGRQVYLQAIATANWGSSVRFDISTSDNANILPTPRFTVSPEGKVGIGTTSPAHTLDVCGTIRASEIKVDLQGSCGADFVFKDDYKLMDLKDLETFVRTNRHLPEVAPEKQMLEDGVNINELQIKLLQKIEELTLYLIEQNSRITEIEEENKCLRKEINLINKDLFFEKN